MFCKSILKNGNSFFIFVEKKVRKKALGLNNRTIKRAKKVPALDTVLIDEGFSIHPKCPKMIQKTFFGKL